jgi:hypothetical protein
MRFLYGMMVVCLGVSAAAGIPKTQIYGEYVEARNADVYTGFCFANSEVNQAGDLAVMAWKIRQGTWQGVPLDGLAVVGVIRASHTLGDVTHAAYPVKAVLIIDNRADSAQRVALKSLAQAMSGDLLQDVVRVYYEPVELSFAGGNVHSMKATLEAGSLAEIRTRALDSRDHVCGNEDLYYLPLAKVRHAMAAATVAHSFRGQGLGEQWSSPDKRSAFVGTFQYQD